MYMNAQTETSAVARRRLVSRHLEDMNAPAQTSLCTVKIAQLVSCDLIAKVFIITIFRTESLNKIRETNAI